LAYARTTPYRGRWPMANRRTLRRQWWGAFSATRRAGQPARTNHSNALPAALALCLGFAFGWRPAVRQNLCPPTTAPRSRRVAEKSPYPPSQIPMNRTKSCLIVVKPLIIRGGGSRGDARAVRSAPFKVAARPVRAPGAGQRGTRDGKVPCPRRPESRRYDSRLETPMNRAKSSLIVANRESSNRALCRPSNARCSNQAAPSHPAFPFCASCAFLRQINFSPLSDFGFRPSDLFLGWTAYVHPPMRESNHE
jgi:hypothetical protein